MYLMNGMGLGGEHTWDAALAAHILRWRRVAAATAPLALPQLGRDLRGEVVRVADDALQRVGLRGAYD